jgi:putative ABC transport system permease protein
MAPMWSDRIIGNSSRLPFALLLSLRSQLFHRRASTVLTVLALSAGVGLATIVELSTRSVAIPLRETTRALMGQAQVSVSAGDVGVPEALIAEIRAAPGVRLASPIISRTFRVAEGPSAGLPVRLVGIDLLQPHGIREFGVSTGGLKLRDPLRLLAAPNALVISEGLAKRLGAVEGDSIHLRAEGQQQEFIVRGSLTGPLSDAYGGQIALMDVFGLQEVLGFRGRIDRIDVAPEPGVALPELTESLEKVVGEDVSVYRARLSETAFGAVMTMLNSGIWSIAAVGILLSLFLTYCVTSLTVDRRIEEFLLLRTVGWSGRRVTTLILLDTVLIASVATIIGFSAAALFADSLVVSLSKASSYLHHSEIPPTSVAPSTMLVSLLAGVPVAVLAAAHPALRAGRAVPLTALREHRAPPSSHRARRSMLLTGFCAAMVALLAWADPGRALNGDVRVALVICSSVLSVGILVTQTLLLFYKNLQALLGYSFPRVGYVALAAMLQRPVEAGATLAIWAATTASLVAMFSIIQSFVTSFDDFWVGIQGPDAIVAFGQAPLSALDREPITRENVEIIRSTSGVLAVAGFYSVEVMIQGEPINLESFATRAIMEHSNGAPTLSDDPEATAAALLRGELSMNRTFSRRFGLSVGDELRIATDRGPNQFKIGAMDRSYAGSAGSLLLDVGEFERWFRPAGASHATIWAREPKQSVVDEIHRRVQSQALFLRWGRAEAEATAIMVDQYNDLLVIPVFLVASVGALALTTLVFGSVVSRRRDLAVLRASGASRRRIRSVILFNGLTLGGIGTASGVLLGLPWTTVLADRVAGQLGYEAAVSIDTEAATAIVCGAAVLSLLATWVSSAFSGAEQVRTGVSEIS